MIVATADGRSIRLDDADGPVGVRGGRPRRVDWQQACGRWHPGRCRAHRTRDMLIRMSHLEDLLARNRSFAAGDAKNKVPAIPFIPNRQIYIITCIDPRVDPAAVLGLDLGDAIVARNVGGRVTPAVLRDLGWITHLHRTKTPEADWFEIAVIHHTDCGSALLADDELRHEFATAGGFDDAELAALAVTDPTITAKSDVETLLASPMVDGHVRVSGHVYDLGTGLVTGVVPPRSRGER